MMKPAIILSLLFSLVWTSVGNAQSQNPQRPLDLRITGTLLAEESDKRDDLVTVDISVQGKPMLLRVGKVEDLTTPERARAVKDDVLLRQVRFTGPEDLMAQLQKPELLGRVITIEGWLDTKARRMQVTAVKEGTGSPGQGE
jgi:hypothetical protein